MRDVIVSINAGQISGRQNAGVEYFLSVPYAAPPVGANRFKAPQPVEPWTGVRDAGISGANAPQRTGEVPGLDAESLIGKGWHRGDDYLTLNIWKPEGTCKDAPVMVFIHGGGFVVGSKDAPVSDGSSFAFNGIICVAINYRMGIDGFMPIDDVPTNLGLRDQIFALEWVQSQIHRFGGDPNNVTVFGESAGAMSVANLIASPKAEGLFKRAIIQSGHGAMTRSITTAKKLTYKMARLLGVPATAAGFASCDLDKVLDAVEKISKPIPGVDLRDEHGFEPVFGISRFIPVHGDDILPQPPLQALQDGRGAQVQVLIGTNAEEMNLYLVPTGVREKMFGLLAVWLLHRSHPNARKTLKAYGLGKRKAGHVLADAMNDLVFRWPARRFAEEHLGQTHFYEFEWRSPAFGGELGACHALELPFVFNTLPTATGPQGLAGAAPPQALADHIHGVWCEFARSGRLPWAEFDKVERKVYRLEAQMVVNEPVMRAAEFLP